jgi:TIR domain
MTKALGIGKYKYDAFLSHAVEDKILFANDLEKALTERGCKIWYSGKELGTGDHLEQAILDGLRQSRYGVIIVSHTYLTKVWALTEFAAFFLRQQDGQQVILPVLWNITPEEVAKFIPINKLFYIKADKGMEAIADKLAEQIGKLKARDTKREKKILLRRVLAAVVALAIVSASFLFTISYFRGAGPDEDTVKKAIEERIALTTSLAEKASSMTILTSETTSPLDLKSGFAKFKIIESSQRNTYNLKTGLASFTSKKSVNEKLEVDMDVNMTPLTAFKLDSCTIHLHETRDAVGRQVLSALYINLRKVTYSTDESMSGLGRHQISVLFQNNVRIVEVKMIYPLSSKDTRRYDVSLIALPPSEIITFHASGSGWKPEFHP